MFQVVGVMLLSFCGLLMVILSIIMAPAIFSFQPFDYRKVSIRVGSLFVPAMMSMIVGASLYEEHIPPLSLRTAIELVGAVFVGILFAISISYINFRMLRSLSATFAQREERLAELKQEREREHSAGDSA